MRKEKLWRALFCGGIASAMILTGCSQSSGNSLEVSDTSVSGTVESIDGNTITLTTSNGMSGGPGGQMDGNGPGGDMGTPPDGNDGSGDSNSSDSGSQTPPEKPEDAGSDSNSDSSSDSSSNSGSDAKESSGNSNNAPDGQSNSNAPGGNGGDNNGAGSNSGMTMELVLKDTSVLKDSDDKSTKLSDIEEGDTLTVTIDEDGEITSVVIGDAQSGNNSQGVTDYSALQEFTEDTEVSDETYKSTNSDENAIHIYNGAEVTLNKVKASRDSSDSTGGDNSSFYGVGADVLTTDGTAYVNGGTFTTDANGGAGLFAYGDGTVYASDAKISTSADTSGGIHAAGGGTLYAWDLDVTTQGNSSAAIRSDRGGGTMVVDGGSYTSTGTGSPAVYCTADISVNNADLTAEGSEGICLEGKNSLRLYDCDLTGNMSDDNQNDCTWNVILYQSMSGDSEEGEGIFQMTGGSLTAENGGMFYTTNTESTFYLSDVDITPADDSEFFLRCTGNNNQRGWGESGSNGADCNFTAASQQMEGDIIYDSISNLDFYMTDGSTLTGAFVDDESCAGNGGDGTCNAYISSDSTWIVTGDSTLTSLANEGTIKDADGNTVTIKGTDGTVYVQGTGSYTITVGSYSTSADMSGAASADSFSDHAVDKPDQLQ